MSHSSHRWRTLILFAGDIAILYAALFFTLLIRYGSIPSAERWQQHFLPFTFVFIIYLTSFAITGLYQLSIARNSKTFSHALLQAMVAATALAAIFFYVVRPGITPRVNLILFVAISAILITLWRRMLNHFLGSALLIRTVVLGYSKDALTLATTMHRNPQLGYALIRWIVRDDEYPLEESEHVRHLGLPLHVVPSREDIAPRITHERVELIVTATDQHISPSLLQALFTHREVRTQIIDLPTLYETVTGKVPVESIGELWFMKHATGAHKPLYEIFKRAFDLALSLLSLIMAAPLTPFIYAAIKLESPGSGFFLQHRVGRNGKIFLAMKFRSMDLYAEKNGPQWAMPYDPRVTKVGRFLRKTRLDELPQLMNVLKGDMSFVGPRPERPEFVEALSKKIPFYRERLAVKPGLTGWDQISGTYHSASPEDTMEKLQYDLYYIKNRSTVLDVAILLRTIKTVLSAEGR
ncbi:MAG: sugar transferase [Patescibacteria group bacterium]